MRRRTITETVLLGVLFGVGLGLTFWGFTGRGDAGFVVGLFFAVIGAGFFPFVLR